MGICQRCIHFRRVRPVSVLLGQAVATTDAAVSNALVNIQQDEIQQKGHEAQFKSKKETSSEDTWIFRPIMSEFCGLREADEIYLIAEVKNLGGRCTDFVAGRPEPRRCSNCEYFVKPGGPEMDRALIQKFMALRANTSIMGDSTQMVDTWLSGFEQGIGPRIAFEITAAYHAKGVLSAKPMYLAYCKKFSRQDEYVICLMQNPHLTCTAWEQGSE
jgi:hypothetical protein